MKIKYSKIFDWTISAVERPELDSWGRAKCPKCSGFCEYMNYAVKIVYKHHGTHKKVFKYPKTSFIHLVDYLDDIGSLQKARQFYQKKVKRIKSENSK